MAFDAVTVRSIPLQPLPQPPFPHQSTTIAIHIVHSLLIASHLPRITHPQSLLAIHIPFLHVQPPFVWSLLLLFS